MKKGTRFVWADLIYTQLRLNWLKDLTLTIGNMFRKYVNKKHLVNKKEVFLS